VPDMTPEEHKRRSDAADALFREMKRQIAEKTGQDDGQAQQGWQAAQSRASPAHGAFPRWLIGGATGP
jgi:hypothetical protein